MVSVKEVCNAILRAGGDPLFVGGCVRDRILGLDPKDTDIEVYHLSLDALKNALSPFGDVELIGKAFGVFKVAGCDISIPRRDSKTAPGHKGFEISFDPNMSVEEAARRRDFTMNAISMSVDGEIIDPYHGQDDIKAGILKIVDPVTFVEDPLRVLRAAQFIARFGFKPDAGLLKLSASIAHTMKELPGERLFDEWNKLLLKGKTPSKGIEFLRDVGVLSLLFPEIHALIGVPQEPEWHPEGWLVTELPIGTPNCALITSMTQPKSVDLLGKNAVGSKTTDAPIEGGGFTPATQPIINDLITDRLPATFSAGALNILSSKKPSLVPPVTTLAEAKSFKWSIGTPAVDARKVVRIMFEIMQSSMGASIDNLEIIRGVVRSVVVYVMDVFAPLKFASKLKLHDDPVKPDGPVSTWPTGVYVTVIQMDSTTSAVNNNVVYTVELVIQDADIHTFMYSCKVDVGDVFVHTNMAIDAATESRTGDVAHDMTLMYATLCHDFGKSWTTKFEEGRWRARGHEEAGVEPSMAFLGRLRAPTELMKQVATLVSHHLAPAHFAHPNMKASPKAYRALARKLDESGTTMEMLYKVGKADHFGRTTRDAIAREYPAGDEFMAKAKEIKVETKPEPDVVMGRHLLARGMTPGKEFGIILTKCREIQYETGIKEPEEILKQVLI